MKKIFQNWAGNYEELKKANNRRNGKEEEGRLEEKFKKSIKKLLVLNKLNKESFIQKEIKYSGKANRTLNSFKNAEKYVDCIVDEYQNILNQKKAKKNH